MQNIFELTWTTLNEDEWIWADWTLKANAVEWDSDAHAERLNWRALPGAGGGLGRG